MPDAIVMPNTVTPENTNIQTLLNNVIETLDDIIIITQKNGEDQEIIYVNEGFESITGYSKDEALGQSPKMLQGEATDPEELAELSALLASGEVYRGELLNYNKDGSTYWVDMHIAPIKNTDGAVQYFAATGRDITERKLGEKEHKKTISQLKRANMRAEAITRDMEDNIERLKAADIAKTEFLANISHELRTPMMAVLGFSEIGMDKWESAPRERLLKNFSRINESGKRLLRLINDLLDLSKIEQGKMDFNMDEVDIQKCMDTVLAEIEVLVDQKKVNISQENHLEHATLVGDGARIEQVILNLLSNAVKFTPADKKIRFGFKDTTLEFAGSEVAGVEFYLEDEGPGLPEDELKDIFDKFVQSSKTKTGAGGTGLGLAVSKEIIEAHGGSIWAECADSGGAIFRFAIPRKQ